MITYSEDKKHAYFDGEKFTLEKSSGYYQHSKSSLRLHQAVWIYYNGEIPEDHYVHHKDGDKSNNSIENLELIASNEHSKIHGKQRVKKDLGWFQEFNLKGRKAAKKWHQSEEGKKWHKKHYEKFKNKLHQEKEFVCKQCGEKFMAENKGNNKYCSNKCKSAYRREKGLDDVVKECVICGDEFKTNKYSGGKTCSQSCASKLAYKNRDK